MSVLDNDDIRWVIELAEREGLHELEVNVGDSGVAVKRGAPAAQAVLTVPVDEVPTGPSTDESLVAVTAPMAGAFYRSSAPDAPPFVEAGDIVQQGETVGLIEAMKLYNDVEAPVTGRVESILVDDAGRVADDQQLMLIRPLG